MVGGYSHPLNQSLISKTFMFKMVTKRVDIVVNHCSIHENFETWRHFADIKNKNLKYNGKSVLKILLKF